MPVYGYMAIVLAQSHSVWKARVLCVAAALLLMPYQIYCAIVACLSTFNPMSSM